VTTRRIKNITRDFVYHLSFLLLAILAILLYKERLFGDGSHDLMCVINREWFCLIHGRKILLFSQWLPLTGVLLKLKLKYILIFYSLGHVLFFYFLFLISHYHFKDKSAGIIYLVLQTTITGWAYFAFPMSEILYVNGFIVLLTSVVLSTDKPNWYSRSVVLLLLFFILSSHPLSLVTLVMTGLLLFGDKAMTKDPVMLKLTFLICTFLAITGTMGGNHHGPPIISVVEKFLFSVMTIQMNEVRPLLGSHVLILSLTALYAAHFLRSKNYIKLGVLLIAGLMPMLIGLVNVKFPAQLPNIYKSVFSVIVIMTVTYELAKTYTGKYLHTFSRFVLAVYFTIGLFSIIDSAKYFVYERSVVESILASLEGSGRDRYILEYNAPVKDPPYQRSLFYSAGKEPGSARSIRFMQDFGEVLANKAQLTPEVAGLMIDSMLIADSIMIADEGLHSFDMFMLYHLNNSYFKLSDQPPLLINQNGFNEASKIKRFANLELELPSSFSRFRKLNTYPFEYHINIHINYMIDEKLLYSGVENGLAVKMSFYKNDKEPFSTQEFPLLSDIYGQGWFPVQATAYDNEDFCIVAELTKKGSSMGVADTLCLKWKSFGLFHVLYNH